MSKPDLTRERERRYVPNIPPQEYDAQFLLQELSRLQLVIENLTRYNLIEIHSAPDKPRDGDLAYADGADWNPGGGRGLYFRLGNSWKRVTPSGEANVVSESGSFTVSKQVPRTHTFINAPQKVFSLNGSVPTVTT